MYQAVLKDLTVRNLGRRTDGGGTGVKTVLDKLF